MFICSPEALKQTNTIFFFIRIIEKRKIICYSKYYLIGDNYLFKPLIVFFCTSKFTNSFYLQQPDIDRL